MDKDEFMRKLENRLNERYGTGYKVVIKTVLKYNGVKRMSVTLYKEQIDCSPAIYIDDLYQQYKETDDIDNVADIVINLLKVVNCTNYNFDIDILKTWELVKTKLDLRIMSKEMNKELLKDIIWIDYLDLAVYPVVILTRTKDGSTSVKVTRKLAEEWGVSGDDILREAMTNAWSQNLYGCKDVSELLKEHHYSSKQEIQLNDIIQPFKMLILSNDELNYGAAAILDKEFMKLIHYRIGGPFFVLPSSVHETIAFRSDRADVAELRSIVRNINKRYVNDEEVLSNNVYYFDGENLSIAKEGACEDV